MRHRRHHSPIQIPGFPVQLNLGGGGKMEPPTKGEVIAMLLIVLAILAGITWMAWPDIERMMQ